MYKYVPNSYDGVIPQDALDLFEYIKTRFMALAFTIDTDTRDKIEIAIKIKLYQTSKMSTKLCVFIQDVNNDTLMHYAYKANSLVALSLKRHGALEDVVNNEGKTPLDVGREFLMTNGIPRKIRSDSNSNNNNLKI